MVRASKGAGRRPILKMMSYTLAVWNLFALPFLRRWVVIASLLAACCSSPQMRGAMPVITPLSAAMASGRAVAVVGQRSPHNVSSFGFPSDWELILEAKVQEALQRRSQVRIVDVRSRRNRLAESAFSQSGVSQETLQIGRELAAASMIFVQLASAPQTECKIERVMDSSHPAGAFLSSVAGPAEFGESDSVWRRTLRSAAENVSGVRETGVRYTTFIYTVRVVNTETGDSRTAAVTAPYRTENASGNRECPTLLAAVDGALNSGAGAIASVLAGTIEEAEYPLLAAVDDLDENVSEVRGELEAGIRQVEANDFEGAERTFQKGLRLSGNRSAAARWNLAVVSWRQGKFDAAREQFERFFDEAPADWKTTERLEIWVRFREATR